MINCNQYRSIIRIYIIFYSRITTSVIELLIEACEEVQFVVIIPESELLDWQGVVLECPLVTLDYCYKYMYKVYV